MQYNRRQQSVINKLKKAENLLREVYPVLVELNTGGNQFDFTSSSELGNVSSNVESMAKKVDHLVYQKKSR